MKKKGVFISLVVLSILLLSIVSVSAVWYNPFTWFDSGEYCGDGDCNNDETCDICSDDCGTCQIIEVCGNGICDFNEDSSSCLQDCPVEYCGDGACNNNEDCSICPSDCGVCDDSYCGDGICDPRPNTEGCDNCEADCGVCPIYGCMNPAANNYDSTATVSDESCTYDDPVEIYGCTNSLANNYNSEATQDDGSCTFDSEILGCTNSLANNYDSSATVDDGSCTFDYISGCTNSSANNYNSEATQDDGSCTFDSEIYGCTNSLANNYNSEATIDDGSCTFEVSGECQLSLSNMKIYMTEKYKADTLEKRKFTPEKITPFDDIVCEVQFENTPPSSDVTCPIHTIKGELKTMSNPEASEADDTNWDVTLKDGVFEDSNDEDGKYSWEVKGWGDDDDHPVGWSSGDNLDKLIEAKKVKCFAYIEDKPEVKDSTSQLEQPYSNCVHLWGKDDAQFNFNFLVTKNSDKYKDSKDLIGFSFDFKKNGIESTAPFSIDQSYYSYFIDLKKIDDSKWGTNGPRYAPSPGGDFATQPVDFVNQGSCGGDKYNILLNTKTLCGYWAEPSNVIFYNFETCTNNAPPEVTPPKMIIHELGHEIGDLMDEYQKSISVGSLGLFFYTYNKNCFHNSNFLGRPTIPKWAPDYGSWDFRGCEIFTDYYRPSEASLMNNGGLMRSRFNVVSCGYILQKIKGGSIESAWQECNGMNTIKSNIN